MTDRPQVGVCAIIKKDNKILLGLRRGAHGAGAWSFPGGHLEYGESWEECAQRETLEEAGIKIKNLQFLTITNDIFPEYHKHYITIFLTADYESGEVSVREPEKCDEWRWVTNNELPEPLFLPILNLQQTSANPWRK